MDTSILIARLIGPILLAIGAGLVLHQQAFKDMARAFLDSPPLVFTSGILTLLGGLVIVNTHNVWVANWPVLITIFGWLCIIGGVVRIVWPETARSIGTQMLDKPELTRVSGFVNLAIGALLAYFGYLA